MRLKKRLLGSSRLYAILDKRALGKRTFLSVADKIKNCGVSIVQLRDKDSGCGEILKNARDIRDFFFKSKVIFLVNDHLEVAKIVDADGLHIGQGDISLRSARKILGKDKIIGVSCHNLRQARRAQEEGADYIAIGPIFRTSTKPQASPVGLGLIREVKKFIRIPFFVIGGISAKNLGKVLSSGASRVAVCGNICRVNDPARAARRLGSLLDFYAKRI